MTPEQAWQRLTEQLQLEMPKGAFEERVRNARVLSWEGGVLTIGVSDDFTSAWLENRMTSYIERQLVGYLNTDIHVRFAVDGTEAAMDPEGPAEASVDDGQDNGTGQTSVDLVEIRAVQTDLYKILTRPHAQTVVPAYLVRWLPFIGSDGGWFIVAMYQAFYFAENARVSEENLAASFTVNRKWLATWSGLGERKVVDLLKNTAGPAPGNFISWFIRGSNPEKGKARRYCFRYDMPLTPADVERLTTWLQENRIGESPLAALKKAVDTPIKEILRYPIEPLSKRHRSLEACPKNTLDLVEGLLPADMAPQDRLAAAELARQLHTNIVHPGDNLHITHYFMRNWVGVLKPGPAWVITLLRDKGFQDTGRGVLRDRIRLANGYQELASTLAVTQRRILEWLPPLEEMVRSTSDGNHISTRYKHAKTEAMRRFVLEKDGKIDHSGVKNTEYNFRIRLDDPLLPEHESVYFDVVATLMLAKQGNGQPMGELAAPSRGEKPEVATENAQVDDALLPKLHSLPEGWYRLRAGLLGVATETAQPLVQTPRDIKDSVLKHFNLKVLSEIQQLLRRACLPPSETQAEDVVVVGWDYGKLLQRGGIAPETVLSITNQVSGDSELGLRLVAWCLFGYANKTTQDRKGIDAPMLFAVSRFSKTEPERDYVELAENSPQQLVRMIGNGYRMGFTETKRTILSALRENGFLSILDNLVPETDLHTRSSF